MKKNGYGYLAIQKYNDLRKNCYEKVVYYLSRIENNRIIFKDDCDEVYSFFHHDGNENEVAIENIKGVKLNDKTLYIISDTNSFNYNEECDDYCIFNVLLLIEKEIDKYTYNQIFDIYLNLYNQNYLSEIKKPNHLTDDEFNNYVNRKVELIFDNIQEDIRLNYPLLDCDDVFNWESEIHNDVISAIKEEIIVK